MGKGEELMEETGALKDWFFDFFVEWEVKRSFRYQDYVSLLVIGPDRSPQDEENIRRLIEVVRRNIRETDLIGSLNGDGRRFGILLLCADLDVAYIVGSRIMDHVRKYSFPGEPGERLTISIGGACFPTNTTEKEDLLRLAEEAFHEARKKGDSLFLSGFSI